VQNCQDEVEALRDDIEVGKRRTQENELAKLLSSGGPGPVRGGWFNAIFDSTGQFVLFPSWRGVVAASVATGKVREASWSAPHAGHCLADSAWADYLFAAED
jgi:hypothetical protein